MSKKPTLTIEPNGRRFAIKAGAAVLANFHTRAAAEADLAKNDSLYAFWAGSAGVSIQNTPARIVRI